jgi:glycosyltransferase involved in cell wall biosynthesis
LPILTIIVPTYNRAENLAFLLEALQRDCKPVQETVSVLVSDNASTDGTGEVIKAMQAKWPELRAYRHDINCGADENFCSAVDKVETRYFWIIGDDDCPRSGLVGALVELLVGESPALVYMQSKWTAQIVSAEQAKAIDGLRIEYLDSDEFARRVHVWVTYISGHVVDRSVLLRALNTNTIRRFSNTNLVQLGWILPILQSKERLAFIKDRCVLATVGNSGGYALLTVFGVNFSRIVSESLGHGSRLARLFIGRNIACYLPGLIWLARTVDGGRHHKEDPWPAMRRELNGRLLFWVLLVPLGKFPLVIAGPLFLLWKALRRIASAADRLLAHVR